MFWPVCNCYILHNCFFPDCPLKMNAHLDKKNAAKFEDRLPKTCLHSVNEQKANPSEGIFVASSDYKGMHPSMQACTKPALLFPLPLQFWTEALSTWPALWLAGCGWPAGYDCRLIAPWEDGGGRAGERADGSVGAPVIVALTRHGYGLAECGRGDWTRHSPGPLVSTYQSALKP